MDMMQQPPATPPIRATVCGGRMEIAPATSGTPNLNRMTPPSPHHQAHTMDATGRGREGGRGRLGLGSLAHSLLLLRRRRRHHFLLEVAATTSSSSMRDMQRQEDAPTRMLSIKKTMLVCTYMVYITGGKIREERSLCRRACCYPFFLYQFSG